MNAYLHYIKLQWRYWHNITKSLHLLNFLWVSVFLTHPVYSYSFIFIQFKVIQFIQLCSLCSYSFKQIMSVERPSTARLFAKFSEKSAKMLTYIFGWLRERQYSFYLFPPLWIWHPCGWQSSSTTLCPSFALLHPRYH